MRVVCDFDGTITRRDSLDYVLSRLAPPAWEAVEAAWLSGDITAAQCMRQQIAMIEASVDRLDSVLDEVELDPTFAPFVDLCDARRIPLLVVSDGVDYFIRRILGRERLNYLPLVANRLVLDDHGAWSLEQPWSQAPCTAASGVCKCATLSTGPDGPVIYIGDGRSDFCAAGQADLVFAKGALADHCRASGIAFQPFEAFDDVARALTPILARDADLTRERV